MYAYLVEKLVIKTLFTIAEITNEFTTEVKEKISMEIQKKWLTLLMCVLSLLTTLGISVHQIRMVICNFPASRKHTNILLFQEHLETLRNAASLEEIFELLGLYEYWGWNNPHLLEAIVHALGTESLKRLVCQYKKDLEVYRINLKLAEYAVLMHQNVGRKKPDFETMIFKLGVRWSEYTLQCVEEFWAAVVDEFSLFPYALIFHHAEPGCVSLTFLIPSSLAPSLVLDSKNKISFFEKHDIHTLKIAENVVVDISLKVSSIS